MSLTVMSDTTDRIVNRVADELENRMNVPNDKTTISLSQSPESFYTKIAAYTSIGVLLLAGIPFFIAYGGTRQEVSHNKQAVAHNRQEVLRVDDKVDQIEKVLPAISEKLKYQNKINESVLEQLKLLRQELKERP